MSERTNFKLAYEGTTHRFTSMYQGEELLTAVKAKVASVVGEAAELCWIDDESSCVLDSVADLQTAIEFAKCTRKSDTAFPCVQLVIAGSEEEKAAVALLVQTPVTEDQVKHAVEMAEGVDEDEKEERDENEEKTESSDDDTSSSDSDEESESSDEEVEKPQLGVGMQALMRHLQQALPQIRTAEHRQMNKDDDEDSEEESESETESESDSEEEETKDEEELALDVTQESEDEEEEEAVEEEKTVPEEQQVPVSFWGTMAKGMSAITPRGAAPTVPPLMTSSATVAPPPAPPAQQKATEATRPITEDMLASLRASLDSTAIKMQLDACKRDMNRVSELLNKAAELTKKQDIEDQEPKRLAYKEQLASDARDCAFDLSIAHAAAQQDPMVEHMAECARLRARELVQKAKDMKQVEAEEKKLEVKKEKKTVDEVYKVEKEVEVKKEEKNVKKEDAREADLQAREAALALKEEAFVKKMAEFAVKMEDIEEGMKRLEERVEMVEQGEEVMEGLEKRLDAVEERLAKVEEEMDDEDVVYM